MTLSTSLSPVAVEPPVLMTARLRLRPLEMADFPDYAAFLATDRARYMSGPMGVEKAWSFFTNDTAQWRLLGMGGLMIERRDGGPAIGQVAVCHGPLFPEAELGWLLYEGHEGHGFVHEAAQCLRGWAYDVRCLDTLVSYVDRDNRRSQRVAERLGATIDPDAPKFDPEDIVYRHPRPGAPA
jgi:RimJ/RimL family protein N-acetyltransferase